MTKEPTILEKDGSLKALQATNFFLADVQTGPGPFLAAYLAGAGWEPGRVGVALTLGAIITVILKHRLVRWWTAFDPSDSSL